MPFESIAFSLYQEFWSSKLVISICFFDRNEPVEVPKTPVPVAVITEKSPDVVRSSITNANRFGSYNDDDECGDDDQLPDFEKDDMLARRTGFNQKPSAGQVFNAFLPKPGAVKHKITPVGGLQSSLKPREQETASSLDRLGPSGNEAFAPECCFCGVRGKKIV